MRYNDFVVLDTRWMLILCPNIGLFRWQTYKLIMKNGKDC